MKNKILILILLIFISSCSKKIYKEYSFEQKNARKLIFHFTNDTLGYFKVDYLCNDSLTNIQNFSYKKLSKGVFSIKGIDRLQTDESFISIPLEKINKCVIPTNYYFSINKIPLIKNETIIIYKKKLFWQKTEGEKAISKLLFMSGRPYREQVPLLGKLPGR